MPATSLYRPCPSDYLCLSWLSLSLCLSLSVSLTMNVSLWFLSWLLSLSPLSLPPSLSVSLALSTSVSLAVYPLLFLCPSGSFPICLSVPLSILPWLSLPLSHALSLPSSRSKCCQAKTVRNPPPPFPCSSCMLQRPASQQPGQSLDGSKDGRMHAPADVQRSLSQDNI